MGFLYHRNGLHTQYVTQYVAQPAPAVRTPKHRGPTCFAYTRNARNSLVRPGDKPCAQTGLR
jgi:hypothetical protein